MSSAKMQGTMNKGMRITIVVLTVLLLHTSSRGQNVNYSQYRNAPFFLNPAGVGATNEVSLSVLHRSQPLTESQKYNTSSLMIVVPLLDEKHTKRWGGWGLSLLNDQVKGGLDFRTQGISGAYAYNLQVAKQHNISFGMQAGYYQRKMALNGLSTSNQWVDHIGYVPALGTGENMEDGRKNYLSLATGFLYYIEDDNHRHMTEFGVAALNVNEPDISLTANRDAIPVKITAHGSIALMKSEPFLMYGEMLFYRENYINTYHVGARLSYYFDNRNPIDPLQQGSIDFKAGYRVNNAITTELQFHQPGFVVGFAYDFGITSKESYRSPNDVVEFSCSLRKVIGRSKSTKPKRPETYTTIGKVRDFYSDAPASDPKNSKHGADAGDTVSVEQAAHGPESSFKLKHDFKFGFNDATLNGESKAYLDDMVALMKGNSAIRLEVIGHTDNVGTAAANRKVSLQRAMVVIDYLIQKGIAPQKLTATPMGAKDPLVANDNEANRALNRRVEFVIYNR